MYDTLQATIKDGANFDERLRAWGIRAVADLMCNRDGDDQTKYDLAKDTWKIIARKNPFLTQMEAKSLYDEYISYFGPENSSEAETYSTVLQPDETRQSVRLAVEKSQEAFLVVDALEESQYANFDSFGHSSPARQQIVEGLVEAALITSEKPSILLAGALCRSTICEFQIESNYLAKRGIIGPSRLVVQDLEGITTTIEASKRGIEFIPSDLTSIHEPFADLIYTDNVFSSLRSGKGERSIGSINEARNLIGGLISRLNQGGSLIMYEKITHVPEDILDWPGIQIFMYFDPLVFPKRREQAQWFIDANCPIPANSLDVNSQQVMVLIRKNDGAEGDQVFRQHYGLST